LLKDAKRLQRAEYSHHAIVSSGIWDGVNVRAGGNRSQLRVAPDPAGANVADCVLAKGQPGLSAEIFHEGPPLEVGLGKQHPRDDRRGGFGNGSQIVDLALQSLLVNYEGVQGNPCRS
jgi:hypothetical protein